MPFARRTKLGLAAASAMVVLVAVAAATLQRIPAGQVGLAPGRLVKNGWTIHAPFNSLATIPAEGEIAASGIPLSTKEGSRLEFDLLLRYSLVGTVSPELSADIRSMGLTRAITGLAGRVLADVSKQSDVESLLSQPSRAEGPLRTVLHAAGFSADRLSLSSTIGDEIIRRRSTEEAKALVRAPLGRILVVGWDGADWRTAVPLMDAGRMPHLSRLVREGASGDLRSNDPMFSPLLWTTIATGKAPTEHGIADFLVKDTSGARHPITSDFRKVKALWNILGDFDRESAWIGWWASYPAEPIRGLMVTDYLAAAVTRSGAEAASRLAGVASPEGSLTSLTSELVGAAQISREEVARIIPVTEAEYREALAEIAAPTKSGDGPKASASTAFVMRVLAQARTYHNIALSELRAGVPVVAVYFEAIDMMGHGFQHFLPPKMSFVSEADYERFRDAVPNFYAWQDERLGELLAAAGRDTVTVVLSDHGFRTGEDRPNFPPSIKGQPEEWHRDWGIVSLHGPGIAARRLPPSSIFDIAPTLLYLCGLPIPDDMPGRLIEGAFAPGVLSRLAPTRTKSYELVGARRQRVSSAHGDAEVMQEMLANLKALGYVGGSDDASVPARTAGKEPGAAESTESGSAETQFFFHRNLAVSYMRQGRYREAEEELLQANARQPRAKTYAMLSEARARQGRFDAAAAALGEGWSRLPAEMEPSSLLWIVELHLLSGDRAAAAAAASEWSPRMSPAVKAAVDGRLAEDAGDGPSAMMRYRQALEQDPLLVRVAQRLQALNAASGQPFALEPFLRESLRTHPNVDAYWDLAGQISLARGDLPSAMERFRKAVDIEPENATYLSHLASAQAASGRMEDARQTLAWVDRFPPGDVDGWMALGAAWDRLGDPDRAVLAFRKARNSAAGPGADIGEALALARAGRNAEARRVIEEGLRRYPESAALRSLAARLGG